MQTRLWRLNFQARLRLALTFILTVGTANPFVDSFTVTPSIQAVLDSISADSLRGHLSFLASDLLEGRDSPSRGLDLAAEYIAAQFRRATLEPLGDEGYFQTAHWFLAKQDMREFSLQLEVGGQTLRAEPDDVSFRYKSAFEISASSLFKLQYAKSAVSALKAEEVKGRTIITEIPDLTKEVHSRREELFREQRSFLRELGELGVALVISVERSSSKGDGAGPGWLIDPERRETSNQLQTIPLFRVYHPEWVKAYDRLVPGSNPGSVTAGVKAPKEQPVQLRNVAGLVRGSDPVLRETYVLVTAHYDHVGMKPFDEGDRIYNGANDDGSGTVSVIELASALTRLSVKPKRSLVFMTVFGEEKGLLGSLYYTRHPLVPLERTVANINLEIIGRTDGSEGIEKNRASLTGFDYSTVGSVLRRAGQLVGVDVYKHDRFSDAFFSRSDNRALAEQGVPAHSLCAVFMYPDYHAVTDHWDRIDYPNLERITRTAALGLIMIAENPVAPEWNEANPKAAPYLKAWASRHKP